MYLNKILICLLIFLVSCGQIKNRKAEIDSKNIKKENYYIIIASFKNEIFSVNFKRNCLIVLLFQPQITKPKSLGIRLEI